MDSGLFEVLNTVGLNVIGLYVVGVFVVVVGAVVVRLYVVGILVVGDNVFNAGAVVGLSVHINIYNKMFCIFHFLYKKKGEFNFLKL